MNALTFSGVELILEQCAADYDRSLADDRALFLRRAAAAGIPQATAHAMLAEHEPVYEAGRAHALNTMRAWLAKQPEIASGDAVTREG